MQRTNVRPLRFAVIAVFGVGLGLLGACGLDEPLVVGGESGEEWLSEAEERKQIHQISLGIETPFGAGDVHLYRLLSGDLEKLETIKFENGNPTVRLAYPAPVSTPSSVVFIHLLHRSYLTDDANELVCFAEVDHSSTRHKLPVRCDLTSTAAYYLATKKIGQSSHHPFHDVEERYPLWSSILGSAENDVFGFYASLIGTLQNTLIGMGRDLFSHERFSVRPIMETAVVQFMDHFQRYGKIDANTFVSGAADIIDRSIPLTRLARYDEVFEEYKYVAEGTLESTGGSLVRRSQSLQLATLDNEVTRFFTTKAFYEMSDYRTHVVQNTQHDTSDERTRLSWDHIPHMYGYNVYFDGEHVGFTQLPSIDLPVSNHGTVTIKAVGYAGEFDGVHHDLSGPTLLAGVAE